MSEPTNTETIDEGRLLSNILNLVQPEEKDVRPPAETPAESAKASEPEAKPAETPTEPAKTPAEPAKPAAETPPATPPAKKVVVKPRQVAQIPEAQVESIVKKTVEAVASKPASTPPAEKPAEPALPDDLTPEEREEIELMRFAEAKDPAKKGLVASQLKFYAAQKDFLTKKLAENGDDYDPSADPEYRKFLSKHAPAFTPADRKRFTTQRITEEAEARATERVRQELAPQITETQRKLKEIEERPRIEKTVGTFSSELEALMPEEVVKYHAENGKDPRKTAEAFPIESEIVLRTMQNAQVYARELLDLRAGLKQIDPENPAHQYLHEFVDNNARYFAANGGNNRIRGGKTFVHPYEYKPEMAKTHWTFDEADVLALLKFTAQNEVKNRISAEQKRIEAYQAAQAKRKAAPTSAATPPPEQKVAPEPTSPVVTAPPMAGVAQVPPQVDDNVVLDILGFGSKKS